MDTTKTTLTARHIAEISAEARAQAAQGFMFDDEVDHSATLAASREPLEAARTASSVTLAVADAASLEGCADDNATLPAAAITVRQMGHHIRHTFCQVFGEVSQEVPALETGAAIGEQAQICAVTVAEAPAPSFWVLQGPYSVHYVWGTEEEAVKYRDEVLHAGRVEWRWRIWSADADLAADLRGGRYDCIDLGQELASLLQIESALFASATEDAEEIIKALEMGVLCDGGISQDDYKCLVSEAVSQRVKEALSGVASANVYTYVSYLKQEIANEGWRILDRLLEDVVEEEDDEGE